MPTDFVQVFLLAAVTEAVSEYFFAGIPRFEKVVKYLSALVGIGLALLYRVDFFSLLGFTPVYPLVSMVFTGIVISRGSNLLNDLLQIVYKFKKEN